MHAPPRARPDRSLRALAALLLALLPACDRNPARPGTGGAPIEWTRVTASGVLEPDFADWRGDSIAFEVVEGAVHHLAVETDSGTGVNIYPAAAQTGDQTPRWVGPGLLVYSSDLAGTMDLWYLEVATGATRRLTAFAGDELTPAPRPGGPGIAYVERSGSGPGRIVLLPDTAMTPLTRYYITPPSLDSSEPSWDSSGSSLCFTAPDAGGHPHVWKLSLADTLAVQLTTGASDDRSPRYSPDGARILFDSDRYGSWGVWTVSPAGEGTALGVLAYDAAGAEIRHPAWSPDGKRILLSSDRGGTRALWILSGPGL